MMQKIRGLFQSHHEKTEQGFIMMITLIIIAAVLSVVVVSVTLSSITELETSDTSLQGERTRYYAEGCLQEALIQLNMDNGYGGGALNLFGTSCAVNIFGIGNNRTVTVIGGIGDYTHEIVVEVTLMPFAVVEWDN